MINTGTDFKPQESSVIGNLPVGAYVGKILGTKIEKIDARDGGSFERLVIQLDVTEGEFQGHYARQYKAQEGGQFAAKYKGVYRINIPQVGSQYEQSQKRGLEHFAWCLQESNKSYKWDGDETKMKGLTIGFSVRERDWAMERNGVVERGTTTEIGRLESAVKVRAGEVQPMKKRELSDADKARFAQAEAQYEQAVEVNDDDLPF